MEVTETYSTVKCLPYYRTEGDSFCFEVVPGNLDESYSHVVIRYDNEITWWSSINLPQQSPDGTTIELTVIFLFLTCWQFFSFSSWLFWHWSTRWSGGLLIKHPGECSGLFGQRSTAVECPCDRDARVGSLFTAWCLISVCTSLTICEASTQSLKPLLRFLVGKETVFSKFRVIHLPISEGFLINLTSSIEPETVCQFHQVTRLGKRNRSRTTVWIMYIN